MMQVRQYSPQDLNSLYRPGDRMRSPASILMAHNSFVRTIEYNEEPVAVIGVVVRWKGCGDVWAVIGDAARGHGLMLTRVSRKLLRDFTSEMGIWRLSAMVRATKPEYARWASLVGFEFESVEEQGAPDGTDIHRYRWLKCPIPNRKQ